MPKFKFISLAPRSAKAFAAVTLGLALGATFVAERDAAACGGCFIPPEDPTVVTDHRMILSVGQGQSTLYDQIRYQGLPSEFAWVLPIAGDAEVGLSADTLFSVMGGFTQTQVIAPPLNCPAAPNCNDSFAAEATSAKDSAPAPNAGGVTVTREENVGPYATVQLQSEDPEALNKWLADNKFTVPADVKPVIAQYVREHFNFLALKLRPDANVQSMRPVRVTTKGPSVVLPLRMVAAGTGAKVGITLWVVGQGRYEPTNFPTFSVKSEELVWDWTKNESNFKALRLERSGGANGGRNWELESAMRMAVSQIVNPLQNGFRGQSSGDYADIPASGNTPAKSADQVREEDLDTLFQSQARTGEFFVTRLRADLAHAALSEDLALAAPADQSVFSNIRQVTREANEPLCPVYVGCTQNGVAPRSEAIQRSTSHCATGPSAPQRGFAAAGFGFVALAVVRGVRRRLQKKA
jgi:hypothetical protein